MSNTATRRAKRAVEAEKLKERQKPGYYAVNVSNYQYTLLLEAQKKGGLTLERVLEVKQTTGGSLVRRGLVRWEEKTRRFGLTQEGLVVMEGYGKAEVERKNYNGVLSKFIEVGERDLERAIEAKMSIEKQGQEGKRV